MAKYMDQSGAQHFAEALMSATKTIGGQTIWGDGDIEAGGGSKIITLASATDFDTYKTDLESNDYKVVLFNFASVDLTGKTVTIENATLFSVYQARRGSIIKNGSIVFRDCSDGNSAGKPVTARYQGLLVAFQNTTKLQFVNCHIVFGVDATINGQGISTFADCTEVEIYQSYIESYEYDTDVPSSPVKLTLYDSTIKGFQFRSATTLDLNSSSASMNNYPYIANHVIRCNIGGITAMTMMNNDSNQCITNTWFEGCVMPAMLSNAVTAVCNVVGCVELNGRTIYAGPDDIVLSSDADFMQYSNALQSPKHKNVIFNAATYTINGNLVQINNATLDTFGHNVTINGASSIVFTNCDVKTKRTTGELSSMESNNSLNFMNVSQIIFDSCNIKLTPHSGKVSTGSPIGKFSFYSCFVELISSTLEFCPQVADTNMQGSLHGFQNSQITIDPGCTLIGASFYTDCKVIFQPSYWDDIVSVDEIINSEKSYIYPRSRCICCNFSRLTNKLGIEGDNQSVFMSKGSYPGYILDVLFDGCAMPNTNLFGSAHKYYTFNCSRCIIPTNFAKGCYTGPSLKTALVATTNGNMII